MLEFGEKINGVTYTERPGAYAIINDGHNKFAFLEVRGRYFLPGGGIDAGDSAEQTVIREAQEEMGAQVVVGKEICSAGEYLYSKSEDEHFHIAGVFFEARVEGQTQGGIEDDHKLTWLTLEEARPNIARQSQLWAIEQTLPK